MILKKRLFKKLKEWQIVQKDTKCVADFGKGRGEGYFADVVLDLNYNS